MGKEITILLAAVRAAAPLKTPALQMHLFHAAEPPSSNIHTWQLCQSDHFPLLNARTQLESLELDSDHRSL